MLDTNDYSVCCEVFLYTGKVRCEQISSGPFRQLAFLLNANVKQIVYNPKLISEVELPKNHADLTDAKYKGKFTQPPWTLNGRSHPRC